MDKFKTYIREHEDKLGNETPEDDSWDVLEGKLVNAYAKKRRLKFNYWIAAAIITGFIVMSVNYLFDNTLSNRQRSSMQRAMKSDSSIKIPANIVMINPGQPTSAEKRKEVIHQKLKKSQSFNRYDSDQVAKIEAAFDTIVYTQKQKINNTPILIADPEYFNYFNKEFDRIQSDQTNLKFEIAKKGFSGIYANQLISTCKEKLEVLTALQMEIEKNNELFKLTHSDNKTEQKVFIKI